MTCPTADGALYMRPATPPRFYLDVALASLRALQALDPPPARFAFAHRGLSDRPAKVLSDALAQLPLWMGVVRGLCAETGQTVWSPEFQAQAVARLMQRDPLFATRDALAEDLREREEEYLRNTLEGMLGQVERESQA
jgi:hypothetical protein